MTSNGRQGSGNHQPAEQGKQEGREGAVPEDIVLGGYRTVLCSAPPLWERRSKVRGWRNFCSIGAMRLPQELCLGLVSRSEKNGSFNSFSSACVEYFRSDR